MSYTNRLLTDNTAYLYKDANTNVFVMNADGTGVKRLTTNPYEDAEPSWSPDGTRIVWSATDRSYSSIWTMNADGSDKVELTHAAPFWV